jgi:hypothetical protein
MHFVKSESPDIDTHLFSDFGGELAWCVVSCDVLGARHHVFLQKEGPRMFTSHHIHSEAKFAS